MKAPIQVESSTIKSIDYFAPLYILTIEFKNGGVYSYRDVGREIWEGLLKAPSKGKYFHKFIRNRFDFKKQI